LLAVLDLKLQTFGSLTETKPPLLPLDES